MVTAFNRKLPITISFDTYVLADVDAMCLEYKINRSEFVRLAVEYTLKNPRGVIKRGK